ncbi:MAG: hypothetical protein CML43_06740 [Rhodobacteraceae bacterium]|nr:hypothetical protein [Paracoccaceae bacterium]
MPDPRARARWRPDRAETARSGAARQLGSARPRVNAPACPALRGARSSAGPRVREKARPGSPNRRASCPFPPCAAPRLRPPSPPPSRSRPSLCPPRIRARRRRPPRRPRTPPRPRNPRRSPRSPTCWPR